MALWAYPRFVHETEQNWQHGDHRLGTVPDGPMVPFLEETMLVVANFVGRLYLVVRFHPSENLLSGRLSYQRDRGAWEEQIVHLLVPPEHLAVDGRADPASPHHAADVHPGEESCGMVRP